MSSTHVASDQASSDASVGSLVRRLAIAALLLAAVTVFASIALAF